MALSAPRFVLDIFSASDEIEMLRYRLQYHKPIAYRTIILEANYTHAGVPKQLHVSAALTPEEIARHAVTIVRVPFTTGEVRRVQQPGCLRSRQCALVLEDAQRRFVNTLVLAELADLRERARGAADVLVHLSDVDELLDVPALRKLRGTAHVPRCISPLLRMYSYGERCPALHPAWAKSVLFNASSGWFEQAVAARPTLALRKLSRGVCPVSHAYLGWHFTYFLSTQQILAKLRSFSHSGEGFILAITHGRDPVAIMESRIRACTSVHGRAYGPAWASFDGRLPELPGLPRHPLAPTRLPREALLKEEAAHAAAAAACNNASRSRGAACQFAQGRLDATRAALRAELA